MLESTITIIVEYLHSSLLAKLLMHSCAHAKHAKTCKFGIQKTSQVLSSGKCMHMMHIFNSNILIYIITCLISQNLEVTDFI